jgi:hypothetical protein
VRLLGDQVRRTGGISPILVIRWPGSGLHGRCVRPSRRDQGTTVHSPQVDSYDTHSLIKVLEQLAVTSTGQRVVLLWDGLSADWSQ